MKHLLLSLLFSCDVEAHRKRIEAQEPERILGATTRILNISRIDYREISWVDSYGRKCTALVGRINSDGLSTGIDCFMEEK